MDTKISEEKLDKSIEGFPIGEIEDISKVSEPPYFVSCPNPWISDFVSKHGHEYNSKTDNYQKEPFTSDVTEGKYDVFYYAHSYHTKVPPKAIIPYIEHYTVPGDVIFDGFCGSGMTGVATKLCNKKNLRNSLEKNDDNKGLRCAVLVDLAPAATNIAHFLNKILDPQKFQKCADAELKKIKNEIGWMFETNHHIKKETNQKLDFDENVKGEINCVIWSDVVVCSNCNKEIILWDATVDQENQKIKSEFNCNNCNALLQTNKLEKAYETIFDKNSKKIIKNRKQIPVLVEYSVKIGKQNKRFLKKPDENDFKILENIENYKIENWFPQQFYLFKGENWGDTYSRKSLKNLSFLSKDCQLVRIF